MANATGLREWDREFEADIRPGHVRGEYLTQRFFRIMING